MNAQLHSLFALRQRMIQPINMLCGTYNTNLSTASARRWKGFYLKDTEILHFIQVLLSLSTHTSSHLQHAASGTPLTHRKNKSANFTFFLLRRTIHSNDVRSWYTLVYVILKITQPHLFDTNQKKMFLSLLYSFQACSVDDGRIINSYI